MTKQNNLMQPPTVETVTIDMPLWDAINYLEDLNATHNWGMERYTELDSETRVVWGWYHSAVIAQPLPKEQTKIKRVAVKYFPPMLDSACDQWEILVDTFSRDAKKYIGRDAYIDEDWERSEFWEFWDIFGGAKQPMTEMDYKAERKNELKQAMQEGRVEQLDARVENDWQAYKREWEKNQPRRKYLDKLWKGTTHEATARYLHTEQNTASNIPVWEQIPEPQRYREILKNWWEGYTCGEIAKKHNYTEKTVRNQLTQLRNKYGGAIVPTDEQRRKRNIKKL